MGRMELGGEEMGRLGLDRSDTSGEHILSSMSGGMARHRGPQVCVSKDSWHRLEEPTGGQNLY